jgi:outer membrane receptor protein involved in Fe transport
LKLVAGDTFRPPRPILAEVCCGQRYQVVSNVAAETGKTLGFEGVFQPSPDLRLGVFVARSDFDEHILRLVGWSQFYIQTYALANVPEARAETAEVVLRWSPSRAVTLDASYSWVSFENTGDEFVTVIVTPPSFEEPQEVPIAITRIPYVPDRTGTFSARFDLPQRTTLSLQVSYTGEMLIQQYDRIDGLLEELRPTPDFWIVNAGFTVPLSRRFDLYAAVNNLNDYVQDDLGDPSTDFNWGPLAGRSRLFGLKIRLPK